MNGPTGQWILKIILPGLRIQSEILTDLRILNLQRLAISSIFWVLIFKFAREEVRIVHLNNLQKYVVSGSDCKFFLSQTRLSARHASVKY